MSKYFLPFSAAAAAAGMLALQLLPLLSRASWTRK